MRRTAFLLLAASSIVVSLSTADARTRPRQGGTLRVEMHTDASQWMNSALRTLVFDSLTQLDGSGAVQPGLAVRWESQSDDRRWQLWLRPGVRFQDGTPLSPVTVVQSLTAEDCNGCPWRSVHAAGDGVVFESETPMPNLPAILANSRYAIVRKDENGNPVGTGPFRFASIANGAVMLSAVDESWRSRPFVNAIELRGGRSLRDQWMDVSSGRADVVEVPADQLRRAQQDRMRLLVSRDSDLIALVVEDKAPATLDPRVREALATSLDRASLFNVVFQKEGEVSASLLPNWLSGYAFLMSPASSRGNGGQAAVNRGTEITLSVETGDPVLQLIAERLALNARDAGLNVRAVAGTSKSAMRLTRIHLEETDPAAAYADVTNQLAMGERMPPADLAAIFHQEQEVLAKHTVIPLLYLPRAMAFGPRVHDFVLSPDGMIRSADFWVEDSK